jgi:hypothetical protein
MTLRQLVPSELARWLDAHSVEGETDFGRPGFNELRLAWIGRLPSKDAEEQLAEWLLHQRAHQIAAQHAYERLMEREPAGIDESGDPLIPAWFGKWWAEILLSHPWDEDLANAVAEATYYLAVEDGVNSAAGDVSSNSDGE